MEDDFGSLGTSFLFIHKILEVQTLISSHQSLQKRVRVSGLKAGDGVGGGEEGTLGLEGEGHCEAVLTTDHVEVEVAGGGDAGEGVGRLGGVGEVAGVEAVEHGIGGLALDRDGGVHFRDRRGLGLRGGTGVQRLEGE